MSAVLRLHEFLEHWGLINSSVTAHHPVPAGVAPVAGCDVAGDSEAWDARETLALIEALESIAEGGTWEDVSAKLGRSADACMQQLMRTPIDAARRRAVRGGSARRADPLLCQLGLARCVGSGERRRCRANDARSRWAATARFSRLWRRRRRRTASKGGNGGGDKCCYTDAARTP